LHGFKSSSTNPITNNPITNAFMKSGKTIIISNRLPVKAEQRQDTVVYHQSEGGLATGLSCVYNKDNCFWIGWPGISAEDAGLRERMERELYKRRLLPVMLNEQEIAGFYEGFSNGTLWPLFHCFPSYAGFNNEEWEMYVSVNRKFADKILEVAGSGDTIWIHDYHLLLVPDMVRRELPDASIGFFQHIPFPSYEIFRLLPWRNELLRGLLGADLIGFHTQEDVEHFVEAIHNITEAAVVETSILSNEILLDERTVTVNAFPMGIDYEKYRSLSVDPATEKVVARIHELVGERKLMVSIDRLDYSKGILHRMNAYNRFLAEHPEFHEKVVFIQLIVPSRDTVSEYEKLREEINQMVGDINTRYGTWDWEPIRYFYRSFSPEALSGLYVAADVALVTPLRDGMNLVSKEFVASKTTSSGVLILSEMAGAAQELKQALLINPHNEEEVAGAIYRALIMPVREQVKRMKAMQRIVAHNNVHYWAASFLRSLEEIKILQQIYHAHMYNEEVEAHVLQQFISRAEAPAILDLLQIPGDSPVQQPVA